MASRSNVSRIEADLSVRALPAGGGLKPIDPLPATSDPNGHSSILILIHGFNVSEKDAGVVYKAFLYRLMYTGWSPPTLPVYKFLWPGDKENKVWSALAYPLQLKTAKEAGRRLYAFLSPLHGPGGGPIDVHFVAHSLGNRLLLQCLDLLRGYAPRVVVRSVTLMAAAVPVSRTQYGGDLYRASLWPRFSQALHSKGDDVLHYAFPSGETAAFDAFMPTAIGRSGEPIANWSHESAFDSFAHGDYWLQPGPPGMVLPCLHWSAPRATAVSSIPSRQTDSRDTSSRSL